MSKSTPMPTVTQEQLKALESAIAILPLITGRNGRNQNVLEQLNQLLDTLAEATGYNLPPSKKPTVPMVYVEPPPLPPAFPVDWIALEADRSALKPDLSALKSNYACRTQHRLGPEHLPSLNEVGD